MVDSGAIQCKKDEVTRLQLFLVHMLPGAGLFA